MTTLWATIGGAVGGALGYILAKFLSRLVPETWRRGMVALVPVMAALICGRVATSLYDFQMSAPASIESTLLANPDLGPLLRAWKEADESSYQTLMSNLSMGIRTNQDSLAQVSMVRAQLAQVVKQRTAFLDDTQAVESVRLARLELEELAPNHSELCLPVFTGGSFGDIRTYLPDELEDRELSFYLAALRANPSLPRDATSGPALEGAISNLLAEVREKVGDDIALIAIGADIAGHEERYCQIAIEVFKAIEAMPTVEAASLIRGMAKSN